MAEIASSKAFILKKIKYGEADLIIQVLLENGHRASFLARSALKSKKRFSGGVLEPTHYVRLTYKTPRTEDSMKTLDEAQLLDSFDGLRKDYDKIETALWALDLLTRIAQEGDTQSGPLFSLLGHGLKALAGEAHNEIWKMQFGLKLLGAQGVLETEDWMISYLKHNISQHAELVKTGVDPSGGQLLWLDRTLRNYLENASV